MTPTNPSPDVAIRLALVDDQSLVRAGFRMVLDAQADMEVVAEAGDGREAIDVLQQNPADVVLMDIRMPRMDGVAATEALCARPGGPRVIVLTTFDLDEYAHTALRAGASGFLLKDAGPEELLTAIRAVHGGDSVIAPSTTRRLIEHFSDHLGPSPAPAIPDPATDPRLGELTGREIEVLVAVARGLTNAEISAELHLAEATVKTHIGRVLAKARLRDRVQMVLLAYETGLVDVRPRS